VFVQGKEEHRKHQPSLPEENVEGEDSESINELDFSGSQPDGGHTWDVEDFVVDTQALRQCVKGAPKSGQALVGSNAALGCV